MTDVTPAAATPAATPDTPAAAAAVAPSSAAAPAATPGDESWLSSLPPELQGDPTLSKYQSLEDFARGHLETKRVASSKAVPMPGDSEESRKAFADALRPESVDAYDFGEVPEVIDAKLVDGFRQFAFDTGLPPHMAKAALDFYSTSIGAQITEANAQSAKEVEAFERDYGSGYQEKLSAVVQMLESFQGGPLQLGNEDMNRLDIKLGSGNLMKFMFALHDRVGDPAYAGEQGATPGMAAIAPENAENIWKQKMADPEWRKQALTAGSAQYNEAQRLQKLIAQHRQKMQSGA